MLNKPRVWRNKTSRVRWGDADAPGTEEWRIRRTGDGFHFSRYIDGLAEASYGCVDGNRAVIYIAAIVHGWEPRRHLSYSDRPAQPAPVRVPVKNLKTPFREVVWRGTTSVAADVRELGISFDSLEGEVIRLRLPIYHALHAATSMLGSIARYENQCQSSTSDGIPSDPKSSPEAVEKVVPDDMSSTACCGDG